MWQVQTQLGPVTEQLFPSLPLPKNSFLFCNIKTLDEVEMPANLILLMTVLVVRHNPMLFQNSDEHFAQLNTFTLHELC